MQLITPQLQGGFLSKITSLSPITNGVYHRSIGVFSKSKKLDLLNVIYSTGRINFDPALSMGSLS